MAEGKLHQGMLCPVCRVDLLMTNRQGVEIDYCPQCRGVWLDRGELDKILERSDVPERAYAGRRDRHHEDDRRRSRDYRDDEEQGRGSWLGDLFNFD